MPEPTNIYFELRHTAIGHALPLAADIARHLQSRQYLGSALIICDQPFVMLSAVRKQWAQLVRHLQKQRASTLNPEEILRFTHTITHMEHTRFLAKAPLGLQTADIYFVEPGQLSGPPNDCSSVYVTTPLSEPALAQLPRGLPQPVLFANYVPTLQLKLHGAQPKSVLEADMLKKWQDVTTFLSGHDINLEQSLSGFTLQPSAMDNALDILLGVSSDFIHLAATFQQALNVAQPAESVPLSQHRLFQAMARLAYQVQALAPNNFSHYLASAFGTKDTASFFLRSAPFGD